MEVTFYRFNKCRNETKQPTGGTVIDVRLKENCSILEPKLILSTPSWDYNYFFIPSFGRYYFVSNFTYIGNQTYQVDGTCDPMASFRGDILQSSQYIVRAATGYDVDIPDVMFPAKGGRNVEYVGSPVGDVQQDYTQGLFVIGAIGENAGYAGIPVVYYGLDFAQMKLLNDYLFNSDNYGSMISDDIVKAFFNPMDYIVSCMYFPYAIGFSSWEDTDIYFGWFKTEGIFAKKVPNYWYTDSGLSFSWPIPKPYSDYRKLNPWTQYRLWILDQWIDLPPEKLYNYSTLNVNIQIDLISGLANTNIDVQNTGESARTIARTSSQFGCPVAMAQLRQDWQGLISSIGSSVGSLFSLDFGKAVEGVADAVNCFLPDPSTRGTNGGLGSAFWNKYIELFCFYCDTAPLNENRVGRPVAKQDIVRNYSGYCLCRGAEIEPDGAYASEIDEITGFMNGGFYVN